MANCVTRMNCGKPRDIDISFLGSYVAMSSALFEFSHLIWVACPWETCVEFSPKVYYLVVNIQKGISTYPTQAFHFLLVRQGLVVRYGPFYLFVCFVVVCLRVQMDRNSTLRRCCNSAKGKSELT